MTTIDPTVSKPGYWFVTAPGQAGVVKYTQTGKLPNATAATFVGTGQGKVSLAKLHAAIARYATWLYEVPATGGHSNVVSIAERANSSGKALYTSSGAGVQPTNDLTIAALLVAAPIGVRVAGASAGGAAAAGAAADAAATGAGETATEGAATAESGAGTATKVAGGGAAGGVASKVASKAASALTGDAGSLLAGAGIVGLLESTGLWKGVLMIIGGMILLGLALRQVATNA